MEFPDLGEHCSVKTCRKLDFLPVKCDACSKVFCSDHMKYTQHSCPSAYKKNVQVPVCPLCNEPVPTKRGTLPDIAVGDHIDNHCLSDRAKSHSGIFKNKCSLKGCKTKELVPILCGECKQNFCLKHRHVTDHECGGLRKQTMNAAQNRYQRHTNTNRNKNHSTNVASIQGNMSEDEALARALQMSMQNENHERRRSQQQNCTLS